MSAEDAKDQVEEVSPPPVVTSTDAETADSALPEEAANSAAVDDEFDGETHYILQEDYDFLLSMGFSENAIKKSVSSGCINTDTCTQWITMHKDHPELDTPLAPDVRVIVKKKKVLTEEERAQKVLELKEKAKQIKEREAAAEVERQHKLEKERIAMGRNILEAKEAREAQQRANAYAERQKEKEADAMARDKIRLQLAVDKLVRQGMTPQEATKQATIEMEESKKRQREEAEAALQKLRGAPAEEDTTSSNGASAKPWNLASVLGKDGELESYLDEVFSVWTPPAATFENLSELATGLSSAARPTLINVLSAIVTEPLNNKKRILRCNGAVFVKSFSNSKASLQILRTVGFDSTTDEQGTPLLVMHTVVLRYLHRALSALTQDA